EILAEVYLELIGGRQPDFALSLTAEADKGQTIAAPVRQRPKPLPPRLTAAERSAHDAFVETLGDAPLWRGSA
ncbi:MAG: DNA polymerase III subunit epsilon, partial [Pseudomonadota bacterium]